MSNRRKSETLKKKMQQRNNVSYNKYAKNHNKETTKKQRWKEIKEYFGYRCVYCGEKKPLEKEHFIPKSKQGKGLKSHNIIPTCRDCNRSKSDQDFKTWYTQSHSYSQKRERKILDFVNKNNQ